jgi:protein required for attachment to host cells
MKKQTTWILVADGGQAKTFLAASKHKIELLSETAIANPPSRDINSDRPGRTFDSKGAGRHAKEPPSDAHDRLETDFIRSVAVQIDAAHEQKAFDKLIVVAAPKALGDLRAAYSKRLAQAVSSEIPKDVTNLSPAELQAFLRQQDILWSA